MRRLLVLLLGLACLPAAQADERKATDWAWGQILEGGVADFGTRCGHLDRRKNVGWGDPCRRLPASFLQDILLDPKSQSQVTTHRVQIRGARIDGTVNLASAEINAVFLLEESKVEGGIILDNSHLTRPFSLYQTVLTEPFDASGSVFDSNVYLNGARFDGYVSLTDAKVGGRLDMSNASFAKALTADGLKVEGALFMNNGATFSGDVTLTDARVGGELSMSEALFAKKLTASGLSVGTALFMNHGAKFGDDVTLIDAKISGQLSMGEASFAKVMNGNGLKIDGALFMNQGATFSGDVDLIDAKVGGQVSMNTASLAKALIADGLKVEGALFMSNGARFGGDVSLVDAKVGGRLDMAKSSFASGVIANGLTIGGAVFMDSGAKFSGDVELIDAKVGGQVSLSAASFAKKVVANGLKVEGALFMGNGTTFSDEVSLIDAKVGGRLDMTKASFAKGMIADGLNVGSSLFMRDATFYSDVSLRAAKVNDLFLDDAVMVRLDLEGTDINEELDITGLGWRCAGVGIGHEAATGGSKALSDSVPLHWRLDNFSASQPGCNQANSVNNRPSLILRNVHANRFQDSADAWPSSLDLEGFRYDRIGGAVGTGQFDMRARPLAQWADWLKRDANFSTQPYVQLGGVLAASGHRETAEQIQYVGRQRERHEAWIRGDWPQWIWLTFLCYVAGYGIGLYTFRVLWWVLGLTVLGGIVLSFSPNARRHSVVWRLGASLHRLLPVVELNKEFKDFFENPAPALNVDERRNLTHFQVGFFSGLAIAGWVLGFFLIAALGGLIPKG